MRWPFLLLLSGCAAARSVPTHENADECFRRVTEEFKSCLEDAEPGAMARIGAGMSQNPTAVALRQDLKAERKASICRVNHESELQACGARVQSEAMRQVDDAQSKRAAAACAAWCDFALPRMEVCTGDTRGALAGARPGCIAKSLAGDPTGQSCTQLRTQERLLACPEFLRSHGLCVDNTDCHRGESCGDGHRCVAGASRAPDRVTSAGEQCRGGDVSACHAFVVFGVVGNTTVPSELGEGVAAALSAACTAARSATACSDLGLLYLKGLGVSRNLVRATEAFERGCQAKEAGACENLERLH